jgi:hypothetical protein
MVPSSSPVHFDPENLHASIDRLLTYQPHHMYLTHYGCVTEIPRLAKDLHDSIDQLVALAKQVTTQGTERRHELTEGMKALWVARARAHGCELATETIIELLLPDITLNVQGLEVWLDKRQPSHKQA